MLSNMLGPTEIKPPDAPQRSDIGGATKKANGIDLPVKRLQKMTTAPMAQPTNGVYKSVDVKSTATLDQVKLNFMRSRHSGHVTKSDERLLRDFRRKFEPTVVVRRSLVKQQRGKRRRKKVASTPPNAQRAITGGASGHSHQTGITGVQNHDKPLKTHKPVSNRVEFTGPRHCSKAGTNLFESFGVGKAIMPLHESDSSKCNGVSPPMSRGANSILHEVNNGNNVDPKKTAVSTEVAPDPNPLVDDRVKVMSTLLYKETHAKKGQLPKHLPVKAKVSSKTIKQWRKNDQIVKKGNSVLQKWRRTSGCSPVKKLNAHMKSSYVPASVTETYAVHASTISKVDPNRTSLPATPDPRHSAPMADRVKLPVWVDAGSHDHTGQQTVTGNATATEARGHMNQYYVVNNTALDLSTSKSLPKQPRKPTCYDRPRGEPVPAIPPISPYAVSRTHAQGDCRPSLVVTIRKTHEHGHAPMTKQPLMLQPSDDQRSKTCNLSTQGKSKMASTGKNPCYMPPTKDTKVVNSIVGGKPGDVPCKSPVNPKKALDGACVTSITSTAKSNCKDIAETTYATVSSNRVDPATKHNGDTQALGSAALPDPTNAKENILARFTPARAPTVASKIAVADVQNTAPSATNNSKHASTISLKVHYTWAAEATTARACDVPCKTIATNQVDTQGVAHVSDTPLTATSIASGDDSSINKSLDSHSTSSPKESCHEAETSITSQCQTTTKVASTEQVTEESQVADCNVPEVGNKTTDSSKLPGIHTILPRLNSCSPSNEISVAWPSEGASDIAETAAKSTQMVELKDKPPACLHSVTTTKNTTEKSEGDVRDCAALTVPTPESLPLSTDEPQNCRSASQAKIALEQKAESSTIEGTSDCTKNQDNTNTDTLTERSDTVKKATTYNDRVLSTETTKESVFTPANYSLSADVSPTVMQDGDTSIRLDKSGKCAPLAAASNESIPPNTSEPGHVCTEHILDGPTMPAVLQLTEDVRQEINHNVAEQSEDTDEPKQRAEDCDTKEATHSHQDDICKVINDSPSPSCTSQLETGAATLDLSPVTKDTSSRLQGDVDMVQNTMNDEGVDVAIARNMVETDASPSTVTPPDGNTKTDEEELAGSNATKEKSFICEDVNSLGQTLTEQTTAEQHPTAATTTSVAAAHSGKVADPEEVQLETKHHTEDDSEEDDDTQPEIIQQECSGPRESNNTEENNETIPPPVQCFKGAVDSAPEAVDEDETEEASSVDPQLSENVHSPAVQIVVENEPSETKPTDETVAHEMGYSSPKADISDGVSCMTPEAHNREPLSPGSTISDNRLPNSDMGEEVESVHKCASSESSHSGSERQCDNDDRGSKETEEISQRTDTDEGQENSTNDLQGNPSTNSTIESNDRSENTLISEGTHNESCTFHVVPTIEDLYNDLELSNDSTVNDMGNQPKVSLKDCSDNMQLVQKQAELHEEIEAGVASQDPVPCSQAATDVSNFAAAVNYKGNCVSFIASPNRADVATESSIVVSPRSCSPVVIDRGLEIDDAVVKNDVENTTSDEAQSCSTNVLHPCSLADVPVKDIMTPEPRIYSSEEGIIAIIPNTTDLSEPKSNICSNQSLLTNAEPIDEGEQDEHSLNTTGAVSKDDTIDNDEVSGEPTENITLTAETFDSISLEKTPDASIRETAAGLEVEIVVATSVCKAERIDSKKHVQDRVEPAESVVEQRSAEPVDGSTPKSNTTVNDNQTSEVPSLERNDGLLDDQSDTLCNNTISVEQETDPMQTKMIVDLERVNQTSEVPSLERNDGLLDDQSDTLCNNTISVEQETDPMQTKMIVDLERDENAESSGNGKDDTVECMTKAKTDPMDVTGNDKEQPETQQQETEDGIVRNTVEHDEGEVSERPILGSVESSDKCEEPKSSINVNITGEDEIAAREDQEAIVTKEDSRSEDITTESETDTGHVEVETLSSGKLNDQPDATGKLDQTSTDNVTNSETKEEDTDKSVTGQSNGEEEIEEDDKSTPSTQTPALENSTVEEPIAEINSRDDGLVEEKTMPKCDIFVNEVTKIDTDVEMAQYKKAMMSQPDENISADAKQTPVETQLPQDNKQRNSQVCGDVLMQTNNIDTKSADPAVAKTEHDEMVARGPPRKFLKERHMRTLQMDVAKGDTTETSCESMSVDGSCPDDKSTESIVENELAVRGDISPAVMTTPPRKAGVRASTSNALLCYEDAQKGRCLYFLGQYTSEEPVTTDSTTAYAKVELPATPSKVEITPTAGVETQQESGNDVSKVPVDEAYHGIMLQENKDSVHRTTTEQFDEEDKVRPDAVHPQESEGGKYLPTSLGKPPDSASVAPVIEVKTGISNTAISEEEGELVIDQSGFEERDDHKENDDKKTCSEDKPAVAMPAGTEGYDGKIEETTGSDQLVSTDNDDIGAKNRKLGQLIKSLKSTISLTADTSPIPPAKDVTTQDINVKELGNQMKPETDRKCRRRKPVEKLKVFNTRARTLSESLSAGAESDPGTPVTAKAEVKVVTRAGSGRGRGQGRVSPRGSRGTGRARSADPAEGVSVALNVKLNPMTSPVMPVSSPSPSSPPPLIAVYPVPVKKRRQCRRPKANHTEDEKPKPKTSRRSRRSKKRNGGWHLFNMWNGASFMSPIVTFFKRNRYQ